MGSYGNIRTTYLCSLLTRGLLVQLLHGLQPERRVLSLRGAQNGHGWYHLVWLAWTQLLTEEGRDEDQAPELPAID